MATVTRAPKVGASYPTDGPDDRACSYFGRENRIDPAEFDAPILHAKGKLAEVFDGIARRGGRPSRMQSVWRVYWEVVVGNLVLAQELEREELQRPG